MADTDALFDDDLDDVVDNVNLITPVPLNTPDDYPLGPTSKFNPRDNIPSTRNVAEAIASSSRLADNTSDSGSSDYITDNLIADPSWNTIKTKKSTNGLSINFGELAKETDSIHFMSDKDQNH